MRTLLGGTDSRTNAFPLVLLAGLLLAANASAQWSQFGGPTRDFRSPERNVLEVWPESGPPQLWSTERPGQYASVVVDGSAVYSMFSGGDNEEIVASLSSTDGSTLWEYKYRVPDPPEEIMLNFGRGPNTSPLIHGDRLLVIGFLGQATCLDKKTGKVLWKVDLVEELGGKIHMFGYSMSPITVGDNVLVPVGGDRGVVALAWETGKVIWSSDPIDVSYASPIRIEVDGQEQIVLVASTEVVGLSPTRGQILWRYPHANGNKNNCAQPLWGKDQRLFVSSHDDGGARVLELKRVEGETRVRELWHKPEIKFFHTSSLRLGDTVYGSSGTWSPTFLTAVDVETGESLWRQRGYNKANLLLVEDKVILTDEDGKVALAELSREGMKVISEFSPLQPTAWAPPTLAGGRLYLRDQHSVMAFDLRKPPAR